MVKSIRKFIVIDFVDKVLTIRQKQGIYVLCWNNKAKLHLQKRDYRDDGARKDCVNVKSQCVLCVR